MPGLWTRCGYQRKVFRPATAGGVKVNLEEIDAGHQQLLNYDQASSYAKQKDSIQKELEISVCSSRMCDFGYGNTA